MQSLQSVHIPFSPSLAQKQHVWHWILQCPITHIQFYSCISFTFLYLTHTASSGKKLMWEFTWGNAEALPRLLWQDIIHKTYINLSKNKCFSCSEKDKGISDRRQQRRNSSFWGTTCKLFPIFCKYRSSTLFWYCKRSAICYRIKDKICVAVLNIAIVRVIWCISYGLYFKRWYSTKCWTISDSK